MSDNTGPALWGQERFEFTYELEVKDFRALLVSQQAMLNAEKNKAEKKSPHAWTVFRALKQIIYCLLLGLAVAVALAVLLRSGMVGQVMIFGLGMVTCFLILLAFGYYNRRFSLQNNALKLFELHRFGGGRHDVVFDADGVNMRLSNSTAHYKWSGLERIDAENGSVLLWLNGASAVILPDRVFADDAARAAFLTKIKEWFDGKI